MKVQPKYEVISDFGIFTHWNYYKAKEHYDSLTGEKALWQHNPTELLISTQDDGKEIGDDDEMPF